MVQAHAFSPEHEVGMHMMLADASGDAAVVEWVDLAKGEHSTPLLVLFPNPVPFETAWRDENGPVARK